MTVLDTRPTITNPELNVRFGGIQTIPNDAYRSYDFICDEDEILPRAVIRIDDKYNQLMKQYWGLETGAKVEETITEGSVSAARLSGITKTYSCNLANLAVAAVYSDETSINEGDGVLEVLCVHPWSIFQDFSFHAYAGKSNSEIIKSLVENTSTRGFSFEDIDDEKFLSTDEDGRIPRYKCGEGDLDFIVKKLLPYTTVNKNPIRFFVDEKNNVHLESFQSMWQKDPKLIIVGGDEQDVTDDDRASAELYGGGTLSQKLLVKVGDQNPDKIIRILKKEVSFDDPATLTTYTGRLNPKVAIGKWKKGLSQTGYVPISAEKMLYSDATGKAYYRNHNMNDLTALSINEQHPFDSFFRIEIDVTFCGHLITVGDNVELSVPMTSDSQKFWIAGKWHVKAIRYTWDKQNGGTLGMKMTLIRPSFMFSYLTTTLMNPDDFYAVGML